MLTFALPMVCAPSTGMIGQQTRTRIRRHVQMPLHELLVTIVH